MGQELTARTRYRGLVKRRLVPVAVTGPLPARGTILTDAAGAEVGEMRSASRCCASMRWTARPSARARRA